MHTHSRLPLHTPHSPPLPCCCCVQMVTREGLKMTMRDSKKRDAESPIVLAFKASMNQVREHAKPLLDIARGAQPPPVQLLYFMAAPTTQGE